MKKPLIRTLAAAMLCATLGMAHAAEPQAQASPDVRLVLLGTKGGPSLLSAKSLPQSSVLMVGDDAYLIDAGYGASLRLVQAGIPLRQIKGIFITHLHSDHVVDYPALLMNSWASGMKQPVAVYGPPGVEAMTDYAWKTFDVDIEKRIVDEGKPDPRKLVQAHRIDAGPVMETPRMKVSALRVPHPPFDDGEAYAYKFEVDGKTIVFSGDITYFPPFADFARNADILVNEVVHVPAVERLAARIGNGSTLAQAIISHHVTAEDVGRIADSADAKKLVLSHFVPADDPELTAEVWREAVAKHYKGPIVVGEDGMEIALD